ncbi:MAG: peroxide stress protein YaaA [Candidatus Marinimicrobia bacterium]|nr:peroxide stress protein YaaA [Candidatus Neomarinimicrobiota bacterium]
MITIISPAKSVNFEDPAPIESFSQPDHLSQSKKLVRYLKRLKKPELMELMSISDNLAALNISRYKAFKPPFHLANAKQALYAFTGDVYRHMRINTYDAEAVEFAQSHLRILSGLYGYLRPLDLIQPYRLEMKTRLTTDRGTDIYRFWGNRISNSLIKDLKLDPTPVLVNLASKEYARAVNFKALKTRVIHVDFKEEEQGELKIIAIFAKWARGLMADYIIQNRINDPEDLKKFRMADYVFSSKDSSATSWVFVRPRPL